MKVIILYYSQTGNTQKIARRIRDGMRDSGADVALRFLKKVSYKELVQYDVIGLGSPVWYEMPPNVRRFVEEMPILVNKLAFSFCTHGTMPDLYFPLVIPRLQKKGLRILSWHNWYGNCTLQHFPEPYYTAGHPDEQDLREAYEWGKMLCILSEKVLSGEIINLPEPPRPNMLPEHANAAIGNLGGFHNVHGKLIRNQEKCIYPKCHICMDNCPMEWINLNVSPQKYGSCGDACDDVHGCTYCELLCPTGAIHPVVPYEQVAPAGKRHHYELFCKVLAKAEEEGKFRRLIAEEDVGEESPFYSVHEGHPRIKLLSFSED